jgi:hypothetical protein
VAEIENGASTMLILKALVNWLKGLIPFLVVIALYRVKDF